MVHSYCCVGLDLLGERLQRANSAMADPPPRDVYVASLDHFPCCPKCGTIALNFLVFLSPDPHVCRVPVLLSAAGGHVGENSTH